MRMAKLNRKVTSEEYASLGEKLLLKVYLSTNRLDDDLFSPVRNLLVTEFIMTGCTLN